MAWARRPFGTKRKTYTKPYGGRKRTVYRKTVATGKAAIGSLQSQLTRLKRQVSITKDVVQYTLGASDVIGNLAGNNVYVKPLMQFANWNRVFGTAADDEYPNECRIMKTNIDCEIDNNGERNNIDYTMYIVSLTKFGMQELLNPANGQLNTPLVQSVHYYQLNNGLVFLNKKYFNILKAKRPMTGVLSGVTTEPQGLRKRYYFKFAWNKGKGFYHKNPSANWNGKPCPSSPSANVFVLIFNNDSTADNSVKFLMNCIHTLEV